MIRYDQRVSTGRQSRRLFPYLFAAFLRLAAQNELVQDHENLVEVVNQVNLLDVVEVVVENLHEQVHQLQASELVVVDIDAEGEVQARVFTIHDLVRAILKVQPSRGGAGECRVG